MPLSHITAAIDGTRAGFEAARQAGRLVAPGGTVRLVAVADPYFSAMNTWAGERLVSAEEVVTSGGEHLAKERLLVRARQALTDARMHLPEGIRVEADMIEGPTHDVLIDAARSTRVLALGSHGGGRMTGLVLASTATDMLRHAACSVLVARPPFDEDEFPRAIAVAVDGSEPSLQALEVARQIEVQCGGRPRLRVVTAGRAPRDAVAPGLPRGLKPGARPVDCCGDVAEWHGLQAIPPRGRSARAPPPRVRRRPAARRTATTGRSPRGHRR